MRVAIDTNGLFTTQAGVARYIRGLCRGLRSLSPRSVSLHQIAWEVENLAYRQPVRSLKTAYRELFWATLVAPLRLRALRCDALHSPAGWFLNPAPGQRCVVTIHDMAVFDRPERFRPWQRTAGQRAYRKALRADRIICISRFTADATMRVLEVPASRIEVIYNGGEFHPDEPAPREEPPENHVPNEFFLFVGSLEPGKNLALLREVYLLAQAQGRTLPPLVIVGARWEGVAREGVPPQGWHYLGRQPDAALVHLYRRAIALVFPSKYEGFGLPLVEAMALGCPVLCSPVASLPEVAEDAALLAELRPVDYLAAMRRLCEESGLREGLIAAGRERSRRFSWARCARETAEVYRTLLV